MLIQRGETAGVLAGLVGSLLLAILLLFAMTGGGFFLALIVLAMLPIALGFLALQSIPGLETAPAAEPAPTVPVVATAPARASVTPWPALAGLIGTAALTIAYLMVMIALQGWAHTRGHLSGDWFSIILVTVGFGILVGMATEAATNHALSGKALALGTVGTGLSMVGLFACCTPLLTRFFAPQVVLPAATFALQYSVPLILIGISANLVGSLGLRRNDLEGAFPR